MDAWMERLANGVQAGYYKIEDGSGELTAIPPEVKEQRYVPVNLRRLADGRLTPLDGKKPILMDGCLDVAIDALGMQVRVFWDREMPLHYPRNTIMAHVRGHVIYLAPSVARMNPETFRRQFGSMLGCIAMRNNDWHVGEAWDKGRNACLVDFGKGIA